MDRPVTLKSGVALQSNYSVQHRSDILMEEQLEAVVKLQADLKSSLLDLESARSDDQLDKCRAAVQECKEKSEKAIMVLQVLTKINTELSFARAELEEALEKQEGDINEARKRVMWLEDRMGVLCGKARLRIQPTQKPKKRFRSPDRSTFRSRLGSDSEKSSASSYVGDPQRMGRNMSIGIKSDTTHRAAMFSASDSGSDYPPYQQQGRAGLADTPSSGAESFLMAQQKMAGRQGLQDSDSESDDRMPAGMPPGLQGMPPMSGPILKSRAPDWESESDYESQGQPQMGGMPAPGETDSQDTHSQRYADKVTTTAGETMRSEDPGSRVTGGQTESQDMEDQTEDYTETTTEDHGGDMTEDVTGSQTETQDRDSEEETTERGDMSETSGTGTPHYSEDGQDTQAFITEVPNNKSVKVQSPKRKPTKKVLEEIKQKEEECEVPSAEEEDRARDYWFSEHHRFEYSQYSDVLLELDPLSYHNVGLALPGSFIEKPQRGFSDLPWRSRRKGSDITDIHKIALDKLAGRVHTMYDKFYDAALLSVRPIQTEGKRETTMLSQYDSAQEGGRRTPTDSRPGVMTAPTTADGLAQPETSTRPVNQAHLRPGLNVYHPKPIPPPELLPLTRMSKDKEFPRLADQFLMEGDFLVHKPAIRIADQRNLYKETKLKLYRDRPKHAEKGPSSMEKKFQLMLEREKSLGTKSAHSSRQSTGKVGPPGTRMSMARTMTKADWAESEAGASTWSRLKPSSRGKEYGGLKWERVKTVVHLNLVSTRPEERRDAAKHLGVLRCGDAMVFFALKERLRVDEDSRTRYEAAKSLILLGCWDEDVLQLILMFLVTGNSEIRQDLIQTMIDGKNVQYVNKKTSTFPELVKVLSHFCRNPDPDDSNAFDSAVLLGKLCVADEYAKFKLLRSLDQSSDTHIKAKALETLVKQLSCSNWEVVQHLLSLFRESPVWKYRALAADLLIVLGKENVCKRGEEEKIYQILERKLWDDPTRDVRISAAKALAALGMFGKACDRIEKRLEDTDEDVRAQAVISVGTLEMKTEKIIRLLLEMLELDASEYVRLMIARTFTVLKLADKRVLRALRERDKVEGALARSPDTSAPDTGPLVPPPHRKHTPLAVFPPIPEHCPTCKPHVIVT